MLERDIFFRFRGIEFTYEVPKCLPWDNINGICIQPIIAPHPIGCHRFFSICLGKIELPLPGDRISTTIAMPINRIDIIIGIEYVDFYEKCREKGKSKCPSLCESSGTFSYAIFCESWKMLKMIWNK